MDGKETFEYVSQVKLMQRMCDLSINKNLIGWTQSFLTARLVEFVIDGF